jgi:hypothetical protein
MKRALGHYNRSKKIIEKIGDNNWLATSLHQVGTIYQERGDYWWNCILICISHTLTTLKIKSFSWFSQAFNTFWGRGMDFWGDFCYDWKPEWER